MANKILIIYLISITLFALSGGLLIAFPLIMNASLAAVPTVDTIARNLILDRCPMTASIINAIIIFTTTLLTLPTLLLPTTRAFLKLQGYLLTTSAFLSLILGLFLWHDTLRTRSNLFPLYSSLPSSQQSLIQSKFNCCGYYSASVPEYVKDGTCTGGIQAALMQGCKEPLSGWVNGFEDLVFTGLFGCVGVDVLAVLATTMLVRERGERERYRYMDLKSGVGGF